MAGSIFNRMKELRPPQAGGTISTPNPNGFTAQRPAGNTPPGMPPKPKAPRAIGTSRRRVGTGTQSTDRASTPTTPPAVQAQTRSNQAYAARLTAQAQATTTRPMTTAPTKPQAAATGRLNAQASQVQSQAVPRAKMYQPSGTAPGKPVPSARMYEKYTRTRRPAQTKQTPK